MLSYLPVSFLSASFRVFGFVEPSLFPDYFDDNEDEFVGIDMSEYEVWLVCGCVVVWLCL